MAVTGLILTTKHLLFTVCRNVYDLTLLEDKTKNALGVRTREILQHLNKGEVSSRGGAEKGLHGRAGLHLRGPVVLQIRDHSWPDVL